MELWIRSQDKMILTKAEQIGAYYTMNKKGEIRVNTYSDISLSIGHYSTMERALEVLDEIQELFEPTTITLDGKYMETRQLDAFVYEMPEK